MGCNTKIDKEKNMEGLKENTNIATISGVVCQELVLANEVEGEKFYDFVVEVKRLSESKDLIPVTISERDLVGIDLKVGDYIKIEGEYRSYNKILSEKAKLVLHLFAKKLAFDDMHENLNEVKLIGFLCKSPIYRKTPFNREICDILLAVNRTNYHKSDYIPCIIWGRNARFIANQVIGCKIEVVGRIQSRKYSKSMPDGSVEEKTAYEVSCQRLTMISSVSNIKKQDDDEVING